jgi:alkylation response protein AidB-like acyl-CoA dehydrogenase
MTFTPEQEALRDALATLLAKRSDSAAVRRAMASEHGYDVELWTTLCELGVPALAIPEVFSGAGAGAAEVHVALEELGRGLTPSPLLGGYLAARLLLALGDDDASARLLPRISAGEIVAVAWADEQGWRAGAVRREGRTLHGTAHYVLDGDLAAVLLVVTPDAVVEVDPDQPGVQRRHTPAVDPTRRLATVSFDGAVGTALGGDSVPSCTQALAAACVALTAEQVGAMAQALAMTVEYSKVRVQFGRPIGSFQALKHRMADLHVLVEAARAASYAALAGELEPSVAKAYCSEAFCTVAGEAIQLHGGIAITWEHDAHLYFKRAYGSAALFGSPADHVAAVAASIGAE